MIETERLILRPWLKDDILPFSAINSDEEATDFMRWKQKAMASLSVMSDSIILILMRGFLPGLRLVGDLLKNIGIKVTLPKPQKPVLIMRG